MARADVRADAGGVWVYLGGPGVALVEVSSDTTRPASIVLAR
jgi:hypothetical protein